MFVFRAGLFEANTDAYELLCVASVITMGGFFNSPSATDEDEPELSLMIVSILPFLTLYFRVAPPTPTYCTDKGDYVL